MSDQGEVSNGRAVDFGLIETLLWTSEGGFRLFPEHLARLRSSAQSLGFVLHEAGVIAALNEAVGGPSADRLRVRLVLNMDGRFQTTIAPIDSVPEGALWKVAVAKVRFSSSDPLLRHKTTRREIYESELAEAQASMGADEVLFLNERGEVCEGARSNVFLKRDGALLTPPLSCGLLPGTLRASLLAAAEARESVLRLDEFRNAEFYMGNSVRGLVRGALAGGVGG